MTPHLKLISHALCPYVQRAVISLTEKGVAFERIDIDLANKPAWFLSLSPLGKTPVLLVNDAPIFESAVILEYLEETIAPALHPADPLLRAQHRAWIEFGSSILAEIGGLYSTAEQASFDKHLAALAKKFAQLEQQLPGGAYFAGDTFSLVDSVFGPAFRYFETIPEFGLFAVTPRINVWRQALAQRPSIARAVGADYPARLQRYIANKGGVLAELMASPIL